jgi:4'-phosphopantetheinyl transferase
MNWSRTNCPCGPAEGEVHLWRACYSDWIGRLASLRSLLDDDEVTRGDRFLRDGDRDRYIFAHGVLRKVLAASYRCDPEGLRFGVGERGKPFLENPSEGSERIEYNLSHSGDLVLIGVCFGGPVGVDVERLSRNVEFEDLSDRFFAPEEAEAVRCRPDGQRRRIFFDTWVCKEAFIKAVGDGLTMPLDSFVVHFEGERTTLGESTGKENPHLKRSWFLDRFEVATDYVGAVAAPLKAPSVTGFLLE